MTELAKHAELMGTMLQTGETLRAGNTAAAVGEWRRDAMVAAGKQELATASRDVEEARRQGRIARSAVQAQAAGSGGGRAPEIHAAIEAETEYSALGALYGGLSRQQALETEGAAAEWSGRQVRRKSRWSAMGGIAEAAPSLSEKYGEPLQDAWGRVRGRFGG